MVKVKYISFASCNAGISALGREGQIFKVANEIRMLDPHQLRVARTYMGEHVAKGFVVVKLG